MGVLSAVANVCAGLESAFIDRSTAPALAVRASVLSGILPG
jgi:hypothetical protein